MVTSPKAMLLKYHTLFKFSFSQKCVCAIFRFCAQTIFLQYVKTEWTFTNDNFRIPASLRARSHTYMRILDIYCNLLRNNYEYTPPESSAVRSFI